MIYITDKKYPNLKKLEVPEGVILYNDGIVNAVLKRGGWEYLPLKNNNFSIGLMFNIQEQTVAIPLLRNGNIGNLFLIDLFPELLIFRFNNYILTCGYKFKLKILNSIFITIENLKLNLYINGKKMEFNSIGTFNTSIPEDFIMSSKSIICEDASQGKFIVELFNLTEIKGFKMKEFEIEKWHRLLTSDGYIIDNCYLSNYNFRQTSIPTFNSNYILDPYNLNV